MYHMERIQDDREHYSFKVAVRSYFSLVAKCNAIREFNLTEIDLFPKVRFYQ